MFWLGVVGLLLNLLVWILGGAKFVSNLKEAVRDEIAGLRKEIAEQREMDLRMYGESLAALRQKISEVEIWGRDNFARRDSVENALAQIQARQQAMDEKMTDQFNRLHDKIVAGITGRS